MLQAGELDGEAALDVPHHAPRGLVTRAPTAGTVSLSIAAPDSETSVIRQVTDVPFGSLSVERGLVSSMRSCRRSSGKPRMCRLVSQVAG